MLIFKQISFSVLLCLALPLFLRAQKPVQDTTIDRPLKVAVKESPPFVHKQANGEWGGISVTLWKLMAAELPNGFEFVEYQDIDPMLDAIARGESDLSINPITVSEDRLKNLEFSQPYYVTYTTIARRAKPSFFTAIRNIFSYRFLSAVAILISVIFLFGLLVWLAERRSNPEQFPNSWKGLRHGFWWSAVTMTTVGYGDKSPVTSSGRTIAVIWMFAAIIMISGLTAGIASALTVQRLEDQVTDLRDLHRIKVGALGGTSTAHFLDQNGVAYVSFDSPEDGLTALQNEEVDALVHDRPILVHAADKLGISEELRIAEKPLKEDYYSLPFTRNSPYVDLINPILVRQLRSPTWLTLRDRYLNQE